MYKAIKAIGGYSIGDEVPTEQALAWKDMYAEPHVEEVSDKPVKKVEAVKEEKPAVKKSISTETKKSARY